MVYTKGLVQMFRGVFAPIPTPFSGEAIDVQALCRNLKRWESTRLSGVVVSGSNGECVLLTRKEKETLIDLVRQNFTPSKKVIAGTGCESTRETISLTRRAAALGADAALVLNPSYYKNAMTSHALRAHFLAVADASPIPVLLYNMPANTGVNMPADLVCELACHPNITGIKDSSGNIVQIAEIVANTPTGFSVFAGSGSFFLATLAVGGAGGTMAVANIMADECASLQECFERGDIESAREIQIRLLPVNDAVTRRWGVAGLKAAMDMLGYSGGAPRMPLQPLGAEESKKLRGILVSAGLLKS